MRFSEISIRQAKSKIKAGEGLDCGTFKFYTSGVTQSKFLDEAQFQGPALIFGTGGSPSVHYCEEEFSTSTDCVVYYPTDDSIDFYCAYQFFKSHMYLLEKGFRGAGLKHIKKEYIENIEINWLNEEQRNVVTGVSKKIDNLIAKRNSQLDKLETLSSALFYEMFGDPIQNERGWDVKKLGDVCVSITDGDHMPPPKSESGIPFLTISDIDKKNRQLVFENTFFVPQSYFDSLKDNRKAHVGDLLYTVTGSYGIPVIVSENRNFCFQRHIALIRPQKNFLNTSFLCVWTLCKSVKLMVDRFATGIAQKTVGLGSIRKFPIILPPLPLQQEFADKIDHIESQKELIRNSIKKLELLKNALMQQYFA